MVFGPITQLRFGLVGVGNTAADLVGYTTLVSLAVPIFVANFVSTTAGLLLSFTLNRNFTFRLRTGEVRNQAFWFFAVTGFVLWAMQPIAITLINSLFPGINVLIPKSAGIAVGFDMEFRPVQQGGFSPAARGHS